MSNAPKFKTFRDLRSLSTSPVKQAENPNNNTGTDGTDEKNTQAKLSPVRDFQKVPNSVSRSLDMFRGKSKQVWDYLWSVTRGAVQPTGLTRKSRREIKEGSGIGSIVTVDAAIEHLVKVGLLKVSHSAGSPFGNEYEVFTPNEIGGTTYTTYTSSTSSRPVQKLDVLVLPLSGIGSIGYSVENKTTYENPKTSLKTNTKNDDEALADLTRILKKSGERISGKISPKTERGNWRELAELLAAELETAAARTNGVSNVPAFLTEHLRRRLSSKPDNQTATKTSKATGVSKSLEIGKRLVGDDIEQQQFVPEALSEEGRQAVLETMRGYIGRGEREFMMSMREVYTAEDWNWLTENLSEEKPKEQQVEQRKSSE
jgi:hypothetical protein